MTDEQITNFQKMYQKHFGEELSGREAYERGSLLVRLIGWVTGQGGVIKKYEYKENTQAK
jgi:hypothetical protein